MRKLSIAYFILFDEFNMTWTVKFVLSSERITPSPWVFGWRYLHNKKFCCWYQLDLQTCDQDYL